MSKITKVYVCPGCNKAWQHAFKARWLGSKKKHYPGTEYYDDFPTYGKEGVTCNGCKKVKSAEKRRPVEQLRSVEQLDLYDQTKSIVQKIRDYQNLK